MYATLALFLLFQTADPLGPAAPRTRSDQVLKVFPIANITVAGLEHYKEAEIIAATGLHVGQQATSDDLQQATDMLGESGIFSTVEYRFIGVVNGVSVVFKVTENAELVPAVFENFVWFTRPELEREVRRRVPLFRGQVPLAGDLMDQISAALGEVLTARGIRGMVRAEHAGALGQRPSAVTFAVEGVEVSVRNVAFTGAVQLDAALLNEAAKPLLGTPYKFSFARDFAARNLRPLYLARGYLAVRVADPQAAIAEHSPAKVAVDVTLPISEGRQYLFLGTAWKANRVFPADQLSQLVSLPQGAPADLPRFEDDLREVRKLYGTRGYLGLAMDVKPDLQPNGTVVMEVTLREGDVYSLGTMRLAGIEEPQRSRMLAVWALAGGEVYDSSYPKRWVEDVRPLLPTESRWEYTLREVIDDKTKTVDVSIELKPKQQ